MRSGLAESKKVYCKSDCVQSFLQVALTAIDILKRQASNSPFRFRWFSLASRSPASTAFWFCDFNLPISSSRSSIRCLVLSRFARWARRSASLFRITRALTSPRTRSRRAALGAIMRSAETASNEMFDNKALIESTDYPGNEWTSLIEQVESRGGFTSSPSPCRFCGDGLPIAEENWVAVPQR